MTGQLNFPPTPAWRTTDPKTSRQAGLAAVGDRQGLRAKVLLAIGLCPDDQGHTDDEVRALLESRGVTFNPPSAIKRRTELVRGGWVEATPDLDGRQATRLNTRGREQGLWRITRRGLEFLYELDRPANCGAPMEKGLYALVCSRHGGGCTTRHPR